MDQIVLFVGIVSTGIGIGWKIGTVQTKVMDKLATLEKIVTNGLSSKVNSIEQQLAQLPCLSLCNEDR